MGSHMGALLAYFLSKLIRVGRLEVECADGTVRTFGNGAGPRLGVRIADRAAEWQIMFDPTLAFGELYMDGRLQVTHGDLYDVIELGERNLLLSGGPRWLVYLDKLRIALRYFHQRNDRPRARRNISSHYDLDHRLYELFLDADQQYSCAYFEHPGQSLEEAQLAKKRHIAAKLRLDRPGLRVLDIGCGWGGAAQFMAECYGATVTGVTVSKNQQLTAQKRCAGLPVDIMLQDYRSMSGNFDAIYSLGMFEHVGVRNYRTYLKKAHELLRPDGLFLLHTIGSNRSSVATDPWIEKYIFPNGQIPSLAQIAAAAEGLWVIEDVHSFGVDYDRTLMAWSANFEQHWPDIAARYGERFRRMWHFWLMASAANFRARKTQLWQIVLSPKGVAGGYHAVR